MFKKKKKGFSLIELNISMLIQLIVLTLAINTTIITFKSYSMLLKNSKYQDSFDDAILNIERLLKAYMIQSIVVEEDNNKITINYKKDNNKPELKKKEIYFESSKNRIVLRTLNENKYQLGFNILMIDVSSFKIIKKGKTYYLKIINLNKDERIICL
ncbi:prepilin-type N-terminal cleavage/methylation domain-containing protein [Clostridium gallinarum]|uniref:prepilin-type N-terminal cleavage/methylation domain-containing protein n=1 Tax=Clostridium gallinarum TaxID=2762246 RepID=UPI00311A9793